LIERLPTLEQIENSVQVENKIIADHQKIAKELEPLIEFIDFRRIQVQVLVDIIELEPLEIVLTKIILNVYRYNTKSINSACGSKLIIEDNGKVIHARNDLDLLHSVRAKMKLENNYIFEWDVIIERDCSWSWVGVCASENFNYEIPAGKQSSGWVLGSMYPEVSTWDNLPSKLYSVLSSIVVLPWSISNSASSEKNLIVKNLLILFTTIMKDLNSWPNY
ncbi:20520_t:CDS:2, partial [Rhizophagus irregularis]